MSDESPNSLGLSDEEFSKLPLPDTQQIDNSSKEPDIVEEPAAQEPKVQEEQEENTTQVEQEVETTEEQEKEEVNTELPEEVKPPEESKQFDDTQPEIEPEDDPNKESKEPKKESESIADVDYKAQYEALFAPLKANGKTMQVKSIDDARKLMQMGANYPLKMAAIKPKFKQLKLLEKNGIETDEDLAYLIDLKNKNPEAIKKLMKDSGLDPLSIDLEKDTEYKPNSYTVDDKEVELDAILDEIKGTDAYDTTIDAVGNKWDDSSRKVILDNPGILRVINDQVSSGIFEQITNAVNYEKSLGRLSGLSDLEAYKQVGDAIQAKGGFASQEPAKQPVIKAMSTPPVNKPSDDPKLKDRKRAASGVKNSAGPKSKKADFNPLAMSDEEFEKAVAGNPTFI